MLANFHSIVTSTISARMHGTEGDMDLKTSPGRRLDKIRYKVFGKLLVLLPSLNRKNKPGSLIPVSERKTQLTFFRTR